MKGFLRCKADHEGRLARHLHCGVTFARPYLGGGFKYFLFSPLLGEDIQID